MLDQYDREIEYLRISVTDRCNLRCKYCMPEGIRWMPMSNLLTYEEIVMAARAAAQLGVKIVKVTGGEPLVRRDVEKLVGCLKRIPGIEKVTMTTNGLLLADKLPALLEAGLDAINVSLDTTDRETYREITGSDSLDAAVEGIEAAVRAGLTVKVNAVSLDLGEENLKSLIDLTRTMPVDVRFIEMMPIGYGKAFPVIHHGKLLEHLRRIYPGLEEDHRAHGYGPAVYYKIPGHAGSIGLISAMHGKFCESCNRVRLTSQGYLKTCLCYRDGADLRQILREELPEGEKMKKLRRVMREAIYRKPAAHCFDKPGEITEKAAMAAIGG